MEIRIGSRWKYLKYSLHSAPTAFVQNNNRNISEVYVEEWVYPFESQEQYLAKVGIEDLLRIKANPAIGYRPGLDRR